MQKGCPGECLRLALVVSTSVLHATWQRITPSVSCVCHPSVKTRILRLEKIHSCGTGFELSATRGVIFGTISRRLDGSDWVLGWSRALQLVRFRRACNCMF